MLKMKQGLQILQLAGIAMFFYIGGNHISNFSKKGKTEGEYPGYYTQWFEEKKSADGTIPHWLRAKWAAWDKAQLVRRGTEKIIDTVIELGPKNVGGRTRGVWIDPRNDKIMLAAGISGGMWRTENGGNSWKPINDQEVSLSPSCITSSPFNPGIVYYGTGETRANSADVGGNGVYKSTDGGKTFSSLASTVGLSGFDAIWDIKHSLDDSNTLFVGTNNNGLWRSTDAGASWARVNNGISGPVNCILVLPNQRVLFSISGSKIYASDSSGKAGTWTVVSLPGFPFTGVGWGRIQLANCRKYPNVCYATFEGTGFTDALLACYKSSNGGRTWVQKTQPVEAGTSYQDYCQMLGVNPVDTNYLVAAGLQIALSTDGGDSWNQMVAGHSDHHSFAACFTNKQEFIVGTDGGVFKYNWNSSLVQANLNNGYNVTQFYAGDFGPYGMVGISGAQDNGTHVSTGKLTTHFVYGGDGAFAHIGLQTGTVAYFSTQNNGIQRADFFDTISQPAKVTPIASISFSSDGVDFINAYTMNPADEYQLYYRTNRYVYRTTGGGDGWEQITNLKSGIKALTCSNEANPVLYFGGNSANLYKMEKAASASLGSEVSYGNSIPASITNDVIKGIAISPKDKYTIFFALSNISNQPRIWKATGMNTTTPVYTSVSGNLPPGLPVNSVAVDPAFPEKNLFAATDFGLYYSTDSGNTWQKEIRIPNVAVFEVKMRSDRKLFAFTHGRGMWYIELTGGAMNVKNVTAATDLKVFPNPASDQLTVKLPAGIKSAKYTLYTSNTDMAGQGVISAINPSIPVSGLANGYYFLTVDTKDRRFTTKVLVKH